MKIVYFGSDVFLPCFEYFLDSHEIAALYTYHNDEDYFTEYSIVKKAKSRGIPVYYESIDPERVKKYFREDRCELFFVAEYNRIIPIPEDLPEFKGMNVHSSLLPQGRSYYPIESAMERGLKETGVSIHKLAPKLDKGDIIAQRSFPVTPEKDSVDIYLECSRNALEMVKQIFGDFEKYWSEAKSQTERLPYWNRPNRELMRLSHGLTREEALAIFRKYNAMTEVKLGEKIYYVTGLSCGVGKLYSEEIFLSPDRVLYGAADGHLRLHILSGEETR